MRTFDLFASDLGTSWISVVDVVVKATLLFVSAGLVSFLLRRRSAALRHIIWTLALAGVLVLPMLSMALPRWHWSLGSHHASCSFAAGELRCRWRGDFSVPQY